jgi:hypothetical protein
LETRPHKKRGFLQSGAKVKLSFEKGAISSKISFFILQKGVCVKKNLATISSASDGDCIYAAKTEAASPQKAAASEKKEAR